MDGVRPGSPVYTRDGLTGSPPAAHRRLVRSSSDPSVGTMDKIAGIPPYPSPPLYTHDFRKVSRQKTRRNSQGQKTAFKVRS